MEPLKERRLLTVDLELVRDINSSASSSIGRLTDAGGTLYFTADDGISGLELWKSDGTESGTVVVKDYFYVGQNPPDLSFFTNVAGTLYFSADDRISDDRISGQELWKSDGTESGTVLVEDLTGDAQSASPAEITLIGDRLFAVASNLVFGRELWSGVLGALPGDIDRNGRLEAADIDALVDAIIGGEHPRPFDLNNDALVDGHDLNRWLELGGAANLPAGTPYLLGDANLDGLVDVSDFNVWNSNRFAPVTAWSRGNCNLDAFVDVSDFNLWNTHRFTASANRQETFSPLGLPVFAAQHDKADGDGHAPRRNTQLRQIDAWFEFLESQI